VMAIARHSTREIGEALVEEFRRKGTGARALTLRADNSGAKVFAGDLRAAEAAESRVRTPR
jgi:hypothetical protein